MEYFREPRPSRTTRAPLPYPGWYLVRCRTYWQRQSTLLGFLLRPERRNTRELSRSPGKLPRHGSRDGRALGNLPDRGRHAPLSRTTLLPYSRQASFPILFRRQDRPRRIYLDVLQLPNEAIERRRLAYPPSRWFLETDQIDSRSSRGSLWHFRRALYSSKAVVSYRASRCTLNAGFRRLAAVSPRATNILLQRLLCPRKRTFFRYCDVKDISTFGHHQSVGTIGTSVAYVFLSSPDNVRRGSKAAV